MLKFEAISAAHRRDDIDCIGAVAKGVAM